MGGDLLLGCQLVEGSNSFFNTWVLHRDDDIDKDVVLRLRFDFDVQLLARC